MAAAGVRSCTKTVNFHTYEEEAHGPDISVLSDCVLFNYQLEVPHQFCLIKFNSSLFRVCEDYRQLTVGDAGLDHEWLCGQAPQCVLVFAVVSFLKEQVRLVHEEVELRDISDQGLRFPWAQIPVAVSKGAATHTHIPLEAPVDKDVRASGLQSVRLTEPHSPFRVELQKRADGVQCADLELLQELDRESQAAYSLELVAQDGGRPPRSATAALSVRVLDANDHSSAFPKGAVVEVELAEDSPVRSLLLQWTRPIPTRAPMATWCSPSVPAPRPRRAASSAWTCARAASPWQDRWTTSGRTPMS